MIIRAIEIVYLPKAEIGIDSTFYTYSSSTVDELGDITVRIDEVYRIIKTNW